MSLSHSEKIPSNAGLSGPDAFRAYFFPRQILRMNETASCLGMSYPHFYRRVKAGTLGLRIRKNEVGERFVLLDDLVNYIFPPEESTSSATPPKRKPGRPRKTYTSDEQKGGAR